MTVRDHCRVVGYVAQALLGAFPHVCVPGITTLAALHDIGKITPGFQVKCPAWIDQNGLRGKATHEAWSLRVSDHARVSQATLQNLLGDERLLPWAAIVGAHHGKLKGARLRLREPWEDERIQLAQ